MIDLECPKCGGVGSVPNNKAQGRLVCRKCRAIFHMGPTGRTVLGEPPPEGSKEERQAKVAALPKATMNEGGFELDLSFDKKKALILAGLLAVLGLSYFFMSREVESLADRAKEVADAFASGNLEYLKKSAASGTADDVVRSYDAIHPQIEDLKKETTTNQLIVTVVVVDENRRQRTGQVAAFFAPKAGDSRSEKIAAAAGTTSGKKSAAEINLNFNLEPTGSWSLDGQRTLQSIGPQQR
jgi:hypothetical protein